MLSLTAGEGAWSFPNLMCQTLSTTYGIRYLLGEVDGGGGEL